MAGRKVNRLTVREIQQINTPGYHPDGAGLYLATTAPGGAVSRRWIFVYQRNGKRREMGLGSLREVTLANARAAAAKARDDLRRGIDPIDARKAERHDATAAGGRAPATFGDCAEKVLANVALECRNPKHIQQWRMTLERYAKPLWDKAAAEITTRDVADVLEQHWAARPETAQRLRGRIEKVLAYAITMGHRSGSNPAVWRGHLENVLAKRRKLTRGHHKALPHSDVAGFMGTLRKRPGISARALEFCILTAARTGEVLGARWGEIDLGRELWTIPAERMKGKREHQVPLTRDVLAILQEMQAHRTMADGGKREFVFPSAGRANDRDGALSIMALTMVLRRMGVDVTVHGFRSTFRDWASECTDVANEVAEMALAHVVQNRVEAAYRRGNLLEKRRQLMSDWADFCRASESGQ